MSNELVARFRRIALERIERVEQVWNRLVQGGASPDHAQEIRRELHTLKGEAQVVGLDDVSLVCQKLEELIAAAERLSYRVPRELDLLVMMAIRFVLLLARDQDDRPLAGIDVDGFVRQVDEAMTVARKAATPSARSAPVSRPPSASASAPSPPAGDRLSAASRRRLGRAAVVAFVESMRATGSARDHLREVWQILSDELSALGAVALATRVRPHAQHAAQRARGAGKEVDIAVALPDDLRASPEVADAFDAAVLQLLENAIDHGIESPARRRAAGKKLPANVTIRCEEGAEEGEIALVVEDDGGGVDLDAVRQRAVERRLIDRDVAPGRTELLELLFVPGFTTRPERAVLVGRGGAGLDVVRAALAARAGSITVRTAAGQGTSFVLRVPRAAGTLAVHRFTACGGLDLPLAVPAAWTVAPIEGNPVAIDPLASLVPDGGGSAPSDGFALRLTRGRFDLCWRAVGPVLAATAERIGAPLDDQPAEVVRIDGREVLLLRPELT
jgi:two-component system, chemotaxis family, sensor kinase CheA